MVVLSSLVLYEEEGSRRYLNNNHNHKYSDMSNCNTRQTWGCLWWLCTLLGHGEHRTFRNVKDDRERMEKIVKPAGCAYELLRPIAIISYSVVEHFECSTLLKHNKVKWKTKLLSSSQIPACDWPVTTSLVSHARLWDCHDFLPWTLNVRRLKIFWKHPTFRNVRRLACTSCVMTFYFCL